MKSLKTEIEINASAEQVWEVLMNHKEYPQWNPFIIDINGNTNVGGILAVQMQLEGKSAMDFQPIVLVNNKAKEFRWIGKVMVSGVFDGEHYFILESLSAEKTRLIQGENFTGLLSGLLYKMIGEDTQKGFEAMNVALKKKVETSK